MMNFDNFRQAVESPKIEIHWAKFANGLICLKTTFLPLTHYFTDLSNITFNSLVVWKMTWGIWQIFIWALESLKIGILMRYFNPKLKKYELKLQRGVICHENEEWRKIWRGIDLSFQRWHEEFDKFWPEQVSKIFNLMCSFWGKYILFELKKCREVIFHEIE